MNVSKTEDSNKKSVDSDLTTNITNITLNITNNNNNNINIGSGNFLSQSVDVNLFNKTENKFDCKNESLFKNKQNSPSFNNFLNSNGDFIFKTPTKENQKQGQPGNL